MKVLVSIHDVKAESFSSPVPSANKATALRDFSTAVNQPGSLLNSHPDDFVLVQVGEFDEIQGVVRPCSVNLANGRDVFVSEVKNG